MNMNLLPRTGSRKGRDGGSKPFQPARSLTVPAVPSAWRVLAPLFPASYSSASKSLPKTRRPSLLATVAPVTAHGCSCPVLDAAIPAPTHQSELGEGSPHPGIPWAQMPCWAHGKHPVHLPDSSSARSTTSHLPVAKTRITLPGETLYL